MTLLFGALTGCEPHPAATWDTGTEPVTVVDGMLTTTTWATRTDAEGLVEVPVEVGADTTSFLVTLSTVRERPVLLAITSPEGEVVLDAADWLGADEELTGAFEVARKTTAAAWPVRGSDPPLTPGTWRTLWASAHQEGGTEPDDSVEVVVMTKDDPDPSRAELTARLVWADGVEQGTGRQAAVQAAVDQWVADWAVYGIDVVPTFHTSALDPTLPFTANGGWELAELGVADPGDLVVVLGDTMIYKPGVFGTSAGTPGSPYPTDYHFVAIALDLFVPPNGYPTADEQQLLTDTLAHEVGHFLGLPHPVSSSWDHWDALTDTPRCSSETQCEQQLGSNLMYPFGYCDGPCSTRTLTPQQQQLLHLSVAAR